MLWKQNLEIINYKKLILPHPKKESFIEKFVKKNEVSSELEPYSYIYPYTFKKH